MIYAAAMSSADQSIARFAGQDAVHIADFHAVPCAATSQAHPWRVLRAIVRARSALISMRLDEASRATAQLARLLNNGGDSLAHHACALRTLEASILVAQDDISAARRVLMSGAWHSRDTLAATVLRYVEWKRGERDGVSVPDGVDYLTAPVGSRALGRILSLSVSAALAFDRLQLVVSTNLATEALELARLRFGDHSPICSLPATLLAQVAYEQGRLEEAEALLRPRLSLIRSSGMLECVARANVLLAKLALHRGRHRASLAILRETEALGRARRWPRLVFIASSEHDRILEILRYQEGHAPERRISRSTTSTVTPFQRGRRASAMAKPLDTWTQPQTSPRPLLLLTGVLDAVSPDEAPSFSAIESAVRRIGLAISHGPVDDGYALLIPWLRIGASRGLRMVFVDAGRPLLALLERLYYALPTNDARLSDLRPYIATVLRATVQSNVEESAPITCRPLSRRETGILRMIAHGMSNKHIAQSLGITPETVKSHAKSIFVKLATRTRAQAVARAEAIGFL